MKGTVEVLVGDIFYEEHQKAMLHQLDLYMQDPMGGHGKLSEKFAQELIVSLKKQTNYLFFLARYNVDFVGVANCFLGFSTFRAKQLINIHDFAVSPGFRRLGVGDALLKMIIEYARDNDICRITLEVRHDNTGAQELYKRNGFTDCEHPMFFWERLI